MKVSLVSLGCSKNLVDSELILGSLKKRGFELSSEEDSDIIIVNTCGFIGDAKKESINTTLELLEYKKKGNCKKFILTGCLVERYSDELSKLLPEVDYFWGTGNILNLHKLLDQDNLSFKQFKPGTLYDPDSPREILTASHTSYVKVSEGCSRTCSFCIIPQMRGQMRSRTIDSIHNEIKNLASIGVKEINLIAQDMTSYGRDIGIDLETLLENISEIEDINWIRLHYCYPWGITDSLLEVIENKETILPYIDMPLQHINDRILKLMKRRVDKKNTLNIIDNLRDKISNLTLRSTFIVGFPGETEEEFEELLEFIQLGYFERAGAFKYSREEGTPASKYDKQLSEEIKEGRLEIFYNTQSEISLNKNRELIGTIQEGVIEGIEDNNQFARISSQAPEVDGITILENSNGFKLGDFVKIKITDCDIYDLFGKILN